MPNAYSEFDHLYKSAYLRVEKMLTGHICTCARHVQLNNMHCIYECHCKQVIYHVSSLFYIITGKKSDKELDHSNHNFVIQGTCLQMQSLEDFNIT